MNSSLPEGRKRRQVVKSCVFCRLRKIKCDKVKPMCGTCKSRNITQCLYTDNSNIQLDSDELFGNRPNVILLQRVNELEATLEGVSSSRSLEGLPRHVRGDCDAVRGMVNAYRDTTVSNRLLQFSSVTLQGGGTISHGLTAIPTTFTVRGRRFHQEYEKIWQRLKRELEKTGRVKNYTPMSSSVSCIYGVNLIGAISSDLPSFQIVKDSIENFFDSHLNEYFQVLNKDTILDTFFYCFFDNQGNENVATRIVWNPEDTELSYNIGIILLILCFMVFKGTIPPSFESLFTVLCGLNAANTMVLERAQFLLLLCILKMYRGEGGPGCSHLSLVVSTLCATCIFLGLNENLSLSQNQLDICTNIWHWTLFYDLVVSFNLGRPLSVYGSQYDDENLPCNSKGNSAILRNFLYIGRKTMGSLYDRTADPDLEGLIATLTDFLVQNFLPISTYTGLEPNKEVDLFEIVILSPLLAIIVNLYNIRRVLDPQVGMSIKNGFIKFVMISSSLTISTIIRCFKLDKEQNPEMMSNDSEYLSPFLSLGLLSLNYLPVRALMELYGLFFYKLTLFEDGLVVSTDNATFDLSLQDLSIPNDLLFSFKGVFEKFCSIFDTLRQQKYNDLNKCLQKCHFFQLTIALERMNRKIIQIGLEKREDIEGHHGVPSLGLNGLPDDLEQLLTAQTTMEFNEAFEHFTDSDPGNYLDFLNL